MSPKLKKVIIIAIVLMILVFGGLAASMILSGMNTVTITDFKIVDSNNNIMKDQNVYINTTDTNNFKIGMLISADGNSGGYYFYSTNTYVANVVSREDGVYVEYYNSGVATIVAQSYTVAELRDSFKVNVFENYNVDLQFKDSTATDKKTIDIYADKKEYSYKFDLIGLDNEIELNSRLLRVVETSNPDLFAKAEINSNTNSLDICINRFVNQHVVQSSNEFIVIQSCIRDSNGNLVVQDNYVVRVNVICNKIEDIQLEFCDNYDFKSDKTYVLSMISDEDVAKSLINPETEVLLKKLFCGPNLSTFYYKIRIVFANRDTQYVTKSAEIEGLSEYNISNDKQSGVMDDEDYVYTFIFNSFSDEIKYFNIKVSYEDSTINENIERTFVFIHLNEQLDISELYDYKDNCYTFSYFDTRLKRFDTITDINGNIIYFVDKTTGLKFTAIDNDGFNQYDGFISSYTSTNTDTQTLQEDEE